jgi:hypothetical protein
MHLVGVIHMKWVRHPYGLVADNVLSDFYRRVVREKRPIANKFLEIRSNIISTLGVQPVFA